MREKISRCKGVWHLFCAPAEITIIIAVLACFVCKPASALDVELTLGTESAFNVVRGTSVSTGTTIFYVGTSTVGIGTATPSAMFTIAGSSTSGSDVSLRLVNTAGTSLLYAQNDGKVGIGTNTPSSALTVAGTTTVSGNLAVGTSTNTLFVNSANNRVGIGTTTPSAALTVNGAFLRAGSTMIGPESNTHVNLGVESTTGTTSSDVQYATVGGGYQNTASGEWGPTVGGGRNNTASGRYDATVGGGVYNTASGMYTTVVGGDQNTASGYAATVGGGAQNTAAGDYSWAGGRKMQVNANYTFAFGYASTAVSINTADAFIMYGNAGSVKVGVGTTTPSYPIHLASGAHVTTGGVWTDASSRAYKENIRDLKAEDALAALDELSPKRFNYKEDKEEECLGFIAEDVPELVATNDRKGLSPMDIVAVLTKVVQMQKEEIQIQRMEIAGLKQMYYEQRQEIKTLQSRLDERHTVQQCRVGIARQ